MQKTLKKQSPLMKVLKNPYFRFIIFGLLLCSLPLFAKAKIIKNSVITTIGGVWIYSIAALGLNLLLGYSGLISLGTAGFMGLGAYIAAYFTEDLSLSFWVAILVSILIPTLIGILVGFISLRIAGVYLAIATLVVSEILLKTFEQFDDITGGMQGKAANYPIIFGAKLNRETTYILLVVFLILVMMLTYNLVNGQMGRALHAMRGSSVAAQAMGVNLLKYRLIIFSLATAYAGLSGALYVFFIKMSYPTVWNLNFSLYVLAAVVIGGFRSIYGTVAGALIVWAVPDLLLKKLPVIGDIPGLPYIFNGVLIILVILFYPNGLSQIPHDIKNWWGHRKEKKALNAVGGEKI